MSYISEKATNFILLPMRLLLISGLISSYLAFHPRNYNLRNIRPDNHRCYPIKLGDVDSFKKVIASGGIILSIISGYSGFSYASDPVTLKTNIDVEKVEHISDGKASVEKIDFGSFKLPYNHENLPFQEFLGKVTIVFNMKIDDPQTSVQFPELGEMYRRYAKEGLKVHAFPTEQVINLRK